MNSTQQLLIASLANRLAFNKSALLPLADRGAIEPDEIIPPNRAAGARDAFAKAKGAAGIPSGVAGDAVKAENFMRDSLRMSPGKAVSTGGVYGGIGALLGAAGAPKGHTGEGALRGSGAGFGVAAGDAVGSRLGMLLSKLLPKTEGGVIGRLMAPGIASIPGMFAGYAGANKLMGAPSWEGKSAALMPDMYKSAMMGVLGNAAKYVGGRALGAMGKGLATGGKFLAGEGKSMFGNAAARFGRGAAVGGAVGGMTGPNANDTWGATARNVGIGAATGGLLNHFGGAGAGARLKNFGKTIGEYGVGAENAAAHLPMADTGAYGGLAGRGAAGLEAAKGTGSSFAAAMMPGNINKNFINPVNKAWHFGNSVPALGAFGLGSAMATPDAMRTGGQMGSDEALAQMTNKYQQMPMLQRLMLGFNPNALSEQLPASARQRLMQIQRMTQA